MVVYVPPVDVDLVHVDPRAFQAPLAEAGEMARRYSRLFHLPLWCCWAAALDWVAARQRIEPGILHAAHRAAQKERSGMDVGASRKADSLNAR